MENFADQVSAARDALGWSQEDLARRVGVGQQTISRWESGKSAPRGVTLDRVRAVLGLDRGDAAASAALVGLPRISGLPFNNLDEYQFESFSSDLISELLPEATVNRFGTRGEKQYGIDIRVTLPSGERLGIQCKRTLRFQPASLDKARAALDPNQAGVDRCILFLTVPASVTVQQRAAEHPIWEIWDSDTLARKVRGLPVEAALRIVDRYFPELREPFLGVQRPSPWEMPKEAFDRFAQGDRFAHRWTLVGRSTELDQLHAFTEAPRKDVRLGLLVGSAGGGKSRLLKALAEKFENDTSTVIRLAPREPVRPEDFELLPSGRKLLLLVDDAHEHGSNLRALIHGVLRKHSEAKILLATRPYGLPGIREAMRSLSIDYAAVPTWHLEELSAADAAALATEALGSEMTQLARRLAQAVRDCSLLLVAGAIQIREGRLSTRLLETDERIRELITDAFLKSATAGRGGDNPGLREVLRAIALLQPFRENVPAFQQAISALTDQRFHNLTPHLKALEVEGVLLRRGSALRLVPDLLGDVVLADAALTPATGASTGYLEDAYAVLREGEPLLHALVNASRVDWQQRLERPQAPSLIDPLWNELENDVKNADAGGQSAILPFLRQIGAFQAKRVLWLLRWLYEHQPDQAVQAAVPPVLEAVAYDPDCTGDACDLLWEFGRMDPRALHATPEHPLRILTDLAAYEPGKAFFYQQAVIRAVRRWLESGRAQSAHPRMPLELLDPIFEPKAEWTTHDGRSVTIHRSAVPHENVQNIRRQALDVLYVEFESTDPCRSARAALTLGEGLRKAGSTNEQYTLDLLSELRDRTATTAPGPLAALAVHRAVDWQRAYGTAAAQKVAQSVIDALPVSLAHNLAKVLLSNWWTETWLSGELDHEAAAAAWQEQLREVATAAATAAKPEQIYTQIEELLDQGIEVFGAAPGNASPFIVQLVKASPAIAEVICVNAVLSPEPVQQMVLPTALGSLFRDAPSKATERAQALIATDQPALARTVASALAERRADTQIPAETIATLGHELANHPDPSVRQLVLRAAWSLSPYDHSAAVGLAAAVPMQGSADVAEELSNAITIYRWLDWSELNPTQASTILTQLRDIPSLEKYELQRLLAALSASRSMEILGLLLSRVEHWSTVSDRLSYEPLPFHWHVPLNLHTNPQRVRFLRRIHEWTATAPVGTRAEAHRRYCAPELFRLVAGGFDHEVRTMLAEWLRTGSPSQQQSAAVLLRAADADLVWREVSFIGEILQAAAQTSDDLLKLTAQSLHNTVMTGIRHGTPGEPYAEDLEIRDRAAAIIAGLEPESPVERFYRSLQESAEQMIAWETQEDMASDHRTW